jgi:SPW repeat
VSLASHWWFWVLAATLLAGVAAASRRYRELAIAVRRAALRRGLVRLPTGQVLDQMVPGFWTDFSWLAVPAGVWVVLGPWIWGYDQAAGAVPTDAVTGAIVIVVALAGLVFPALWSLNLVAGLWLVVAPWLVGYGDSSGPVGLSDTVAGALVFAAAVSGLAAAERTLRPGGTAIGRIQRRP